ncbi:LysR family transcriptional regulator [Lentibacter algarum]|nr:LysR family transcriptional regulator [Lentibacter algarum]
MGSFTRAAEELNVIHSSISRHIRGLEKRLNAKLFLLH